MKDVNVRVWKEQFPGKEVCNMTTKPDRSPAALKNYSRSKNLSHKSRELLWGTSAPCDDACCKDPSADHGANGRTKNRRAMSVWSKEPHWPVFPTQREICHDFKRKLSLYCAECTDQSGVYCEVFANAV